MAIYPGAVFKPTAFGGKVPRNRQGRGILHVAVSGARSLPPWNSNTWHFYVAHDGYCEQYVDTDFRAYAAGTANDDAIMIETAGGLGTSKVLNAEKWTPAAAARLADIMAWESKQPGGAPLDLLPDSKPGRRGWGPHRLGVQHSRGIGAVPGWLLPGGEKWSSSTGKECPGDAKVAQIPAELLPLARKIAAGGAATNPEELDMDPALLKKIVHETVVEVLDKRGVTDAGNFARDARNLLAQLVAQGPEVEIKPEVIAAAIPAGLAQQVADLLAARLAD